MSTAEFPRDVQLVSEGSSGSAGGCGLGWKEVESAVLAHLMRLADHLVELGVGFVGCQKVVHPLLKDYWQEKVSRYLGIKCALYILQGEREWERVGGGKIKENLYYHGLASICLLLFSPPTG